MDENMDSLSEIRRLTPEDPAEHSAAECGGGAGADLGDRIADQDRGRRSLDKLGMTRGRRFALGCRLFFTEKEPLALSPGATNPDRLGKTEELSFVL